MTTLTQTKMTSKGNFFSNPYLIFFLLLSIPFTVYAIRPDFAGVDTYGFLLLTCKGNTAAGITGLPKIIFEALPCNFLLLKTMLFFCAYASGCFIIALARLFSKENGGKLAWLLFLSPATVISFIPLENDALGFPFLFAAQFFFYKGLIEKNKGFFVLALGLLGIGFLLWRGAIFYLLGFSLNVIAFWVFSIPIVLFYGQTLLGEIFRTNFIQEDLSFQFHYHYALVLGLTGALFNRLLCIQTLFYFALGTIAAKFWILSLPFLAVGLVLGLEKAQAIIIPKQWKINLWQVLGIISVFCLAGASQTAWFNEPTTEHWQAINYALSLDNNVNNDFGLGYWILWKEGVTQSYQSPYLERPLEPGQIFISEQDQNCTLLKDFNHAKVYKC